MDRPTKTMDTTDYRPALLLVLHQMGEAHKQQILEEFETQFRALLPRQRAHLTNLHAADPSPSTEAIDIDKMASLNATNLGRIFAFDGTPLLLDPSGLFARRLQGFVAERGL